MALKKLCRCGKVIEFTDKYCIECAEKFKSYKKDSDKYYDLNKRNKESASVYNSKEWDFLTSQCKAKFKGIDIYSLYVLGELEYGNTSHHIEEITLNQERIYDLTNLIYLTASNHNVIHNLYKEDYEGTKKILFDLVEKWEKEMSM